MELWYNVIAVLPIIQSLEPSPLLTVNQSDSATFECNATGIPAPVISWFMGTEELVFSGSGLALGSGDMMLAPEDLSSRIDIQSRESSYLTSGGYVFSVVSVLTLSPTVGSDSGEYNCSVSNTVGASMMTAEDIETTNLFVQGKS